MRFEMSKQQDIEFLVVGLFKVTVCGDFTLKHKRINYHNDSLIFICRIKKIRSLETTGCFARKEKDARHA